MIHFLWLMLMLVVPAWSLPGMAENCERMVEPDGPVRAVVLVTHGMNLQPERMDEWVVGAKEQGYLAMRGAFTGHCGSNDEYLNVRALQWENDARRMYALGRKEADARKVPLFLVSYSFSAAIFQSLRSELPFDGRLFLAPALSEGKFWYPLVTQLARWFPWVKFPSLNIAGYGVHPWSGFAAIAALSELEVKERKLRLERPDSVPTLVLMNSKDELIEASDLKQLVKLNANWRYEEVSTEGHSLPRTFHHLIVTEESMGKTEWERVSQLAWDFFHKLTKK
jgi:hypothetical protein